MPPKRLKTATLSHPGTTGSSAVTTAQGMPANSVVKSPSTKASRANLSKCLHRSCPQLPRSREDVVVQERLRQDLQCHVPVELGIPGSIHLPHAAFTDLGGDAVGGRGWCRVRVA